MSEGKRRSRKTAGTGRENNFNVIRLVATAFVVVGHMAMIRGDVAPLFAGLTLHTLGVDILFIISGYLITSSWLSDPHPIRYGIKRFFRLWPPFAVMVLVMTFVSGPLLSSLGWREYFNSWYTLYLKNLRFFIVFAQPGVFEYQPIAHSTNGSIWTMPIEVALYVVTPVIVTLLRVRGRSKGSFCAMAAFAGLVCLFEMYLRYFCIEQIFVFYGTDLIAACHLVVYYVIGILFTYDEMKRLLNLQAAFVGLCLLQATQFLPMPIHHLITQWVLPYAVFSFAFAAAPVFAGYGRKVELSYGAYLYAFFFQQLTVYLSLKYGLGWSYMVCLLLSAAMAAAAAALSYYLVERPAQRLSRVLLDRIGKKQAA